MLQEVFVLHDEYSIVPELMFQWFQRIEPVVCPFLRAIRPSSGPLRLTPGIPNLQEAFAAEFDSFDDSVSMVYESKDGSAVGGMDVFRERHTGDEPMDGVAECEDTFRIIYEATEEHIFVRSEELLLPE